MLEQYPEPIEMLGAFCSMYLYSVTATLPASPEPEERFIAFGLTHLACVMFIDDGGPGRAQGLFQFVLKQAGRSSLMRAINRVLGTPVGDGTLRDALLGAREVRPLVDLSLEGGSHQAVINQVRYDGAVSQQFDEAMIDLTNAVQDLAFQLRTL